MLIYLLRVAIVSYRVTWRTLCILDAFGKGLCACGHEFSIGDKVFTKTGKNHGWWPKCEQCAKRFGL